MSEELLAKDIESWLRSHPGRANARPRSELLAHLKGFGHSIDDRAMRKAYASMDRLGSCSKGVFFIMDAEDRRISERSLHSHAMSELVRERRVKNAGAEGQRGLFE